MQGNIFTVWDLIVGPFWLAVILLVAYSLRNSRYSRDPTKAYFLPALLFKLGGGIGVGLVYQFYYNGGDTVNYFNQATILSSAFWNSPGDWLQLMWISDRGDSGIDWQLKFDYLQNIIYSSDIKSYTVVKVASIGNILGFDTYTGSSMILSAFSFAGVWMLFRVLISYFSELKREIAISVLFVPSVFFWGSGILKDSITLGMLGVLLYSVNAVFKLRQGVIVFSLIGLCAAAMIYMIKQYILFSFLPLAIIWLGLSYIQAINSPLARTSFAPFVIVLFIAFSFQAVNFISAGSDRYALEKVLDTAEAVSADLSKDYYYAEGKGSRYNMGKVDASPIGLLASFPVAVSFTLFRPFLWEVNSIVMLLAAIESTVMIWFTIQTFRMVGVGRFFGIVINHPMLLFTFSFSMFFAYMVGLTSGNYGNLVRYKIPAIPFYVATLFAVRYLAKQKTVASQGKPSARPTLRSKVRGPLLHKPLIENSASRAI